MPKREMSYFDARRTEPDSFATRSANLMCFLLRKISYQELYGSTLTTATLDKLIANARDLPLDLQVDSDGNEYDIKSVFYKADGTGAFQRMSQVVSNYGTATPPIVLGDLFWIARNTGPSGSLTPIELARNAIVDILDGIHTGTNKNLVFCCPFVSIQKGYSLLLTEYHIRDFLFYLGGKNIQDFFTTIATPLEREAVARAREAGILNDRRPPLVAAALTDPSEASSNATLGPLSPGNKKKCVNDTCVTSDNSEDWCSIVTREDGTTGCALGSSH